MPAQTMPDALRLPSYFQNPKVLPVAEWLPDQPPLNNPGSTICRNVVPLSPSSYGPIGSLSPVSGISALAAQPLGLFSFIDRTGTDQIFAGTTTKLYQYATGSTGFADVSGTTYSASQFDPWQMTAFGESIIATTGNGPPQIYTVGTSSSFADLATNSAPFGRYVCRVRDFLLFANVIEPTDNREYPQRLHWSALGNPANWPALGSISAAELQSDAQDLRSDLGQIRGVASNLQSADLAIFLDLGVYTGIYIGSPAVFNFQIAQGATGCRVPGSIVSNRGYVYYYGNDGFYAFDGTTPHPIGAEKVDRFFLNDAADGVDPTFLQFTQAAADPTGKLIWWLYCGPSSGGVFNRALIYNWQLQRWSLARLSAQWIGRGLTTGYSLDQLDQFGNMDTLAYSLDSPAWQGGQPQFWAFDGSNNVSTFTGSNLAAVIETTEAQPTPGRRTRITSARPLTDGGSPTITLGSRNRQEDAPAYGTGTPLNAYGECPQYTDARYVRGQINIPAAATWTHCQGVELDFGKSTRR